MPETKYIEQLEAASREQLAALRMAEAVLSIGATGPGIESRVLPQIRAAIANGTAVEKP